MSTIRLSPAEKPFDLDEFSQRLGETQIKITVPATALNEVFKRVVDFMSFGIYVYSVVVIPSPKETLDTFVVQLDRINFSKSLKGWVPFQDELNPPAPTEGAYPAPN